MTGTRPAGCRPPRAVTGMILSVVKLDLRHPDGASADPLRSLFSLHTIFLATVIQFSPPAEAASPYDGPSWSRRGIQSTASCSGRLPSWGERQRTFARTRAAGAGPILMSSEPFRPRPRPAAHTQWESRQAPGAPSSGSCQRGRFAADYWAMKWCDLLKVKAGFPVNLWPDAAQAYHHWIREEIRSNVL